MKGNSTLLLVLFVQISFGQTNVVKEILGQILEKSTSVDGVSVINSATQVAAVSGENGRFSIMAKEGDVLIFSSVNLEPLKHTVTVEDLSSASILIKMTAKEIELKEVIVNENVNITAEKLGIIPYGQKKYTTAERRLISQSSIFGSINGTNEMLKKNLEVEKKETNIQQLGYLFEEAYFVDYLKIAPEYVKGFKFYMVENEYAMKLLKVKDKEKLKLLMGELSLKYNEIIISERK